MAANEAVSKKLGRYRYVGTYLFKNNSRSGCKLEKTLLDVDEVSHDTVPTYLEKLCLPMAKALTAA